MNSKGANVCHFTIRHLPRYIYTHYNILTQKIFYHSSFSFGYQFLLSLAVQFIGFGFAGILRRFVV